MFNYFQNMYLLTYFREKRENVHICACVVRGRRKGEGENPK